MGKNKFITFAVIGGVIIIGFCLMLFMGKTQNANSMYVTKIQVTDKNIDLRAQFINAYVQYSTYSTRYQDKSLFITIKGSLINFHKTSGVNVSINNTFKELNAIYLTDDKNNIKIWSKD